MQCTSKYMFKTVESRGDKAAVSTTAQHTSFRPSREQRPTSRLQVRVEARFRRVQQRQLRGMVAGWRGWMLGFRAGVAAAIRIQAAWVEYRKRYSSAFAFHCVVCGV